MSSYNIPYYSSLEFNYHCINSDGIYIIHFVNDNKNELLLYINNNLIEDSISYNSLYYCIKLNKDDKVSIKNNNSYLNLNNNFNIFKL